MQTSPQIYYTEQQLADIFFNLQKGECPVKYIYINPEWANARSMIEQESTSYQDSEILRNSIWTYLNELWNSKEIALFDFWCGIGNTIKDTLKYLIEQNYVVYYHAFDISNEIIQKCHNNLKKEIPNLKFSSTVIDFETANLIPVMFDIRKQYNHIPILWLFLWNTVWNFTSMERVISNIMDSFRLEDRLLIWLQRVELNNKRRLEQTIKHYESPIVQTIFYSTLHSLWLNQKQWRYYVEFNYKTSTIEWYFECIEVIKLTHQDRSVSFYPWERIRILKSTKIDESNFTKYVVMTQS